MLAGEFQVVCPWLLRELVDLGLWDDNMKNMIIAHNGSIQNIPNIPDRVKAVYKTVWEISQKKVIDLSADRGAFIDQSQSLNIHLQAPTLGQLTSMHFYGWKKGLKTGMYYLRTRPAAQAIQFTVDQSILKSAKAQQGLGLSTAQANRNKTLGLPTPTSSSTSSPQSSPVPPPHSTISSASASASSSTPVAINPEPTTPALTPSTSTSVTTNEQVDSGSEGALAGLSLSLDDKQRSAAEADPEYAAALRRQKERELEDAKLQCSIENKEACLMCSG